MREPQLKILPNKNMSHYDYDDDREHGICDCCGVPCTATKQDFGIGAYEFWGDRGVHHDWRYASPCCGAEVVAGGGKIIRRSVHTARRDHKDGKIKTGQRYRIVVTHCWRDNGPSWFIVEKMPLAA